MTPARIEEIGQLLQSEAMAPLRLPTSLIPRWRQVYHRVAPFLLDNERGLVAATAEAYLCYEAFDDPTWRASRDAAREREVAYSSV